MPSDDRRRTDDIILDTLKTIGEKQDTMLEKITEVATYRTADKQEQDRIRLKLDKHEERIDELEKKVFGSGVLYEWGKLAAVGVFGALATKYFGK